MTPKAECSQQKTTGSVSRNCGPQWSHGNNLMQLIPNRFWSLFGVAAALVFCVLSAHAETPEPNEWESDKNVHAEPGPGIVPQPLLQSHDYEIQTVQCNHGKSAAQCYKSVTVEHLSKLARRLKEFRQKPGAADCYITESEFGNKPLLERIARYLQNLHKIGR